MPGFHLVRLKFRVVGPVNSLPFFHGPLWSAMFRNLLRENGVSKTGPGFPVWVQPVETGIIEYHPGEEISLGLLVMEDAAAPLSEILEGMNSVSTCRGHFQPGVTIRLEETLSRLTGKAWSPGDRPLTLDDIRQEAERLAAGLDEFSIQTISPMRITRPEGLKTPGHRYCDTDFFHAVKGPDAIRRIVDKVRLFPDSTPLSHPRELPGREISAVHLTWLDVTYGSGSANKTMGGFAGTIKVKGPLPRDWCKRLAWGQYSGAGKNGAFGLGFYLIPELENARAVLPLSRSTTLFHRAVATSALETALSELPDSSPGPDRMTVRDARAAGVSLLEKLREKALKGPPDRAALKRYAIPKRDGTSRFIHVQNVSLRIIHKSFANILSPSIDTILSSSAFAYRRGLSCKSAARTLKKLMRKGFTSGIKADISSFFDSVDINCLTGLLRGILPAEPLVEHVSAWLDATRRSGITGLPQGWVLSPVLSNLFLDRFDKRVAQEGFRLVRYADDFVVLYRHGSDESRAKELKELVETALARIGLALKPEKTQTIINGKTFKFLGYIVSAEEIYRESKPDDPPEEEWTPVFKPEWQHGVPIYLTSICRGAFSNGPHLVIKQDDGSSETITWSRTSRIVVVGRASFSGGVVYRAMKENIPVTFIDIMGRTRGRLICSGMESRDLSRFQEEKQADDVWKLDFARRIIAAKINNQYVMLRRNKIMESRLKNLRAKAEAAPSLDSLRGIEGTAARLYFERFPALVKPFEFDGRCYRPPDGPVNAMLSFGYTLLYNRLVSVLQDKGFDPRKGFFHSGRGTHCALASDLLEPLRHIADRIVLTLIHLGETRPEDFSAGKGNNICRLGGEAFRKFINRYEYTMASRFFPYNNKKHKTEKISYNAWLDETTDSLARAIRYDITYEPLRIR